MNIKKLGSQGLSASEIGLGCMGMSEFYGPRNDDESIKTLHRSIELGVTFWDTADMYGPYHNEQLVGKAIKGHREKITLATKFGIVRDPANPKARSFNGKPEYVKSSCEGSLQRLGVDVIDLYYLHRVDPNTTIEETAFALGQLVREGKIKGIGFSEIAPETLRRAHAIHPVTAVQSEYSLWTRDPEEEMLETCRELGIAFVAYSPLGRGFLTGEIQQFEDFAEDDFRRFNPRFQGENFHKNLELVNKIKALAAEKGCTASQLALAWVMAHGDYIFPIPGTKRIKYLEENAAAVDVKLSPEDLISIEKIFPKNAAQGLRYPEHVMQALNR